jgi:membrane protein DedA with SNARE-associated domain
LGKKILSLLVAHAHPYGYFIILLITALEDSVFLGMFVPGDTVVILSGLLASRGFMRLPLVIGLASLGAIFGDNIGYFLGRRYGLPFLIKHGRRLHIREKHLGKTQEFFHKHGGKSVILGRFVVYIRTFVPVVAGLSKMDYKIFMVYNAAGGILWASVFAAIGFLFGESWEKINQILGATGAAVFFLAVIVVISYLLIRHRHSTTKNRS